MRAKGHRDPWLASPFPGRAVGGIAAVLVAAVVLLYPAQARPHEATHEAGALVVDVSSFDAVSLLGMSSAALAAPEDAGQWSAPVDWPLVPVHTALQPTGKVLVWDAFGDAPNSERLWDPATGAFTAVPEGSNLFCAGHATLADGSTIVLGGHVSSNVGLKEANIFKGGTWTRGADMTQSRWYPTATTLADGRLLVASGDNMILGRTGVPQPFVDTSNTLPEVYDPGTNTWTQLPSAQRHMPLYPFLFVLPDGRVFDAGPDKQNRALDLATGQWTLVTTSPIDGGSAVMYRPGKILKTGTWGDAGVDYASDGRAALIDMTQVAPAWREVAPMASPRSFHNLVVLPDGKVLALGGSTRSGGADPLLAVPAAEIWDPATETWTTAAAMQKSRLYHSTSLLLPDGRILSAGGGRFQGNDQLNAEIYSPPYLFKGPRPVISSAPSAAEFGSSFTVGTSQAAQIASVALIRPGSMTHAFDESQRYVPLGFTAGSGTLNVQAPANANIAPPGDYMLFVVDTNGVPSVASFVHVTAAATPPSVSITAPSNNETLTGVTTVTATASDDEAVAGVQFRLDGSPLGAEDTTAPYSVGWDTRTASNGSHTLSAVARDSSGNSTTSSPVQVTVDNSSLVAAYAFDEGAGTSVADRSGSGNGGTVSGATWTTSGKFGAALTFDGTNDWVTVADSISLDLTTGMTLEAWVFPTAQGTAWRTVAFKEQAGNVAYALYGNVDTSVPSTSVFIGGEREARGTSSLLLNAWTHVAATYDGAALRLYVNGSLAGSTAVTGLITTSTGALRIGGNNVWPEWFQGRIDEVRIYSRALSAAEIQTDMNTSVGTPDTQAPSAPSSLAASGGLSSVGLTWTAATDNVGVARYNVHRSTTAGFTPTAANRIAQPTGTSYTDAGLAAGTYFYKVTAEDTAGNVGPVSNEASATVTGDTSPPSAPTSLAAAPGPGQAALTWLASTDNVGVSRYNVHRGTSAGFVPTAGNRIAQPTGTGYTDAGLAAGTYYYKVTAEDAAGNVSAPSNEASATVTTAPPIGLVAAYSFDEGAGASVGDLSGSGNGGTISGATWTAAGRFGSALTFDGTNDLVTVADSSSLDLTSAMTLEAWVFPTALGNAWRTVLMKEQTGNMVYDLYANGTGGSKVPVAEVFVGGAAHDVPAAGALALNTWTHLAATFDGSALRIYVNGTLTASSIVSGTIATSTGALRLGGNNVWPEWFQGRIDEVRIYSRALPQAEIQTDMNTSVGTPDTQAPSAPSSLAASGGISTVGLTWTAATDNVGVGRYNVHRSTLPGFTPSAANRVAQPTGTSYTDLGLAAGTYYYKVTAEDAAGNVGPASNEASATVTGDTSPPTAPSNLTATPAPGSASLSWTGSTDNVGVSRYNVHRSTTAGFVPSVANRIAQPTGTSYADTGLAAGTYYYKVTAEDPAGNVSAPSNEASATVTTAPPVGLVGAYSFDEGAGTAVGDLSGSGNGGTISGATWTTSGRFGSALTFDGINDWVTVADSASLDLTSALTLEAWVFPTALGNAWRTVLMKEQTGNMVYDLYANGTGGSKVPVAEVFVGGGTHDVAAASALALNTWTHVTATYDGSNLRLYVNGTLAGTVAQTGPISTSTGALRIGGNSTWPEWFQGQIDEVRIYSRALSQPEIQTDMNTSVGTPDTQAPTVPTGLAATGSVGTAALTWTAATDNVGVFRYNVHRSTSPGFTPSAANRVAQPTGTSYTDSGLAAGTYFYKVTAEDAAGNVSAPSNEASATVTADTSAPTAPTNLAATPGPGSASLTWTAATDNVGVSRYNVHRSTSAGFTPSAANRVAQPTGTSYTDSGLAAGTYFYKVTAEDAAGNVSAPSNEASATVTAAPPVGLVAGYGFDEGTGTSTADASGNGNNGTVSGAAWTIGKFGTSLSFDGVNDWVTIADSSSLDLTNGMTLEAWVYPTALGSSWRTIVLKENSGNVAYDFYANRDTQVPTGEVRIGGTTRNVDGTSQIALNAWTHLAVTYDGSALRLYTNGNLAASLAVIGAITTSTGALRIGGNNIWPEWFQGQIDEVRVYDRALTQSQIQADTATGVAIDSRDPSVTSVTPVNGAANVAIDAKAEATFSEAMNAASITTNTFEVRDSGGSLVPATISYDPVTAKATLSPTSALLYGTTYTARVKGGSSGVKDLAGRGMAADHTWSFTMEPAPPPVAVLTSGGNPYTTYVSEILRAEGFSFATLSVSLMSPEVLNYYDVVILGEISLSAAQVAMLSNWVTAGGNLIALRPDKQLAGLLGLTDAGATLSNAYLRVDTASGPGAGIVGETIQYHGTADRYALSGASAVATLYSSASVATANPAVTLHNVGTSGGQAAAFTYDLARSVVLTRQGNPAWIGQERDGVFPIRPNDLFFGAASGDLQPDWVDLNKIGIPQADEQQRLLVNLIVTMAADRKPVPRFWYLPRGEKAAVVMTGDDHAQGGTAGRFDQHKAQSPVGCSVALWECVRATSYIYPSSPLTNAQAAGYLTDGFEVSIHVTVTGGLSCDNWTPSSLESTFAGQLSAFAAKYTSVPAPITHRLHCVAWSDWATQAKTEFAHGIRLDTNYYHYPGSWIGSRTGFMTGSGLVMRFADTDGSLIDVYQAHTHMTDESGQAYPATVDTLLDKALGAEGYYGVFTANMHTDQAASAGSDAIVASALARSVPIVSSKQMLDWVDGRNASAFRSFSWNGSTLGFSVAVGSGATGLQVMLPTQSSAGALTSVTRNGSPVAFTTQTIKGIAYAFFSGTAGTYAATYGP